MYIPEAVSIYSAAAAQSGSVALLNLTKLLFHFLFFIFVHIDVFAMFTTSSPDLDL